MNLENIENIEKETEYFKKQLDELIKEKQVFFEELEDNIKKVKDHDHLTGKYRRAAHSICNLNYKVSRFIPVFFHNLSGYDAHLFIKKLSIDKNNIKTITISEENDFLSSSLEKLANTLKPYQFKELSKHYPEQLDLVKGKLAYPYEYMDSPEKYDEESLPNIDKLCSSLTYVIENYRDVSIRHFKLDPVHYYITPGLAWNAMLRKTGVELELMRDIDMYLMFEQGIK
ncbi:Ribonuclease H-like domain [Cinara cedri]|uniref:Ribonuclease H-like domain n=1 Tax=Cinara cedri TaxID=506608 RepID=A0A5E4M2J7_9HEMI|nr:Ribonuclease H-like domain [Cinara cedri]